MTGPVQDAEVDVIVEGSFVEAFDVTDIDIDIEVIDAVEVGPPGPTGPQGEPGIDGIDGKDGQSATYMEFSYNSAEVGAPSAGQVRTNATNNPPAVTALYISNITAPGNDVTRVLAKASVGTNVDLQDKDNSACYETYTLIGDPIPHGTWTEYPVTWVANGLPVPAQRIWVAILIQGAPGLVWRGPWAAGTAYAKNDAVSHVGSNAIASSYICLTPNTGQVPAEGASTTYWGLLAQEGAKGDKGDKGDSTPAGALTTADTTTVDITGDGTVGAPLKADVITGSYPIVTQDTSTVDITGVGTTASPLKADVILAGLPPSGPPVPIYDEGSSLTPWTWTGSGVLSIQSVADSAAGGKVIRVVGRVDPMWRTPLVPFDPNALYRIRVRVRQTVDDANSSTYAGIGGVAADGITAVGAVAAQNVGDGHHAVAGTKLTVAGGWQEFVGYVKGVGSPDGTTGVCPNPSAPGKMHANVRYIRPYVFVNYIGGAGTAEIDYVSLEIVPEPVTPLPLYDEGSLNQWVPVAGAGSVSTVRVSDSAAGGLVIRATGDWAGHRLPLVPYDPTALYRIRYRLRVATNAVTGSCQLIMGVAGVGADGVTLVDPSGGTALYPQYNVCAEFLTVTAAQGWQDFVGYLRGTAATGTQSPCPAPTAPGKVHTNVRYIRPTMFVNWSGTGAVTDVDYVSIEIVPSDVVGTSAGEFTMPSGNVIIGATNVALPPNGVWLRNYSNGHPIESSLRSWSDASPLYLQTFVDGAEKSGLMLSANGQVNVIVGGGISRPFPFAVSAGSVVVAVSASTGGNAAIAFPPNRFTQVPIVVATCISQITYCGSVQNITAAGCTAYVRNVDNASGSGNYSVTWCATQMTPTSVLGGAPALMAEDTFTYTSTCHTPGCEGEDIPITNQAPIGCSSFWCGACSQETTDVTTP